MPCSRHKLLKKLQMTITCLLFLLSTASNILLIDGFSTQQLSTSRCSGSSLYTEDDSSPATTTTTTTGSSSLISSESIRTIERGEVAVLKDWLPPSLTNALREDAKQLFARGEFQPDGLTNTARARSEQGFDSKADRQTFRGGGLGWNDPDLGNSQARQEFGTIMNNLKRELSIGLNRPTLATNAPLKHEITYNWYEVGAKLGRHLDEHHEETKGVQGWRRPTRRSVTWLVYLNDGWVGEQEGGSLRCFPRKEKSRVAVGAHMGNLQVGWLGGNDPIFLDCFRQSGQAALYTVVARNTTHNNDNDDRGDAVEIISISDFDVPSQPIDYLPFLIPKYRHSFDQISTPRLDPRFAASAAPGSSSSPSSSGVNEHKQWATTLNVPPEAGTLVVFDSVTLPHQVEEVTGKRQRIAATGWFHEDSQFHFEA